MFNPTGGPARLSLTNQEVALLQDSRALIADQRRSRPFFFDGRFLAGADLMREQNYFLTRQADLGRVAGAGVSSGLWVTRGENAFSLDIAAGHGVGASGQVFVLPESLSVDLVNIPENERLDASFGLSTIPRAPAQNREGHFIVALRKVQYTANPITSYPTSLSGERSVEDSDIIDGVAITLIPYSDAGAPVNAEQRRGRLAHEIFVNFDQPRMPADVLPLAMIALEGGTVAWVDQFLVRRDIGAAQAGALDFAFASRALREAHLLQYDQHMTDILERTDGQSFSATDYFKTLPAAGKLPRASFDVGTFTQVYFPPELDARLSLVPLDELPALIEESLRLPPIDLTSTEDLAGVSVNILVPISRSMLREIVQPASNASWGTIDSGTTLSVDNNLFGFNPAFGDTGLGLFGGNPFGNVGSLTETAIPQQPMLTNEQWAELISNSANGEPSPTLWYVSRRDIDLQTRVMAAPVSAPSEGDDEGGSNNNGGSGGGNDDNGGGDGGNGDSGNGGDGGPIPDEPQGDFTIPPRLEEILEDDERERLIELANDAESGPATRNLLSLPSIQENPILLTGAALDVINLEDRAPERITLFRSQYQDPRIVPGITRLQQFGLDIEDEELVRTIARSGSVTDIALLGNRSEDVVEEFSLHLAESAAQRDPASVRRFVTQEMQRGDQ